MQPKDSAITIAASSATTSRRFILLPVRRLEAVTTLNECIGWSLEKISLRFLPRVDTERADSDSF